MSTDSDKPHITFVYTNKEDNAAEFYNVEGEFGAKIGLEDDSTKDDVLQCILNVYQFLPDNFIIFSLL